MRPGLGKKLQCDLRDGNFLAQGPAHGVSYALAIAIDIHIRRYEQSQYHQYQDCPQGPPGGAAQHQRTTWNIRDQRVRSKK